MTWTPADFADDADRQYAHAQSYDPASSSDVNSDLQNALRAVASAQDAAREVVKALAQNSTGLTTDHVKIAEGYLASVEISTHKLRDGFDFVRRSV